jgi:phosphohistidine phosphatase
MANFLQKAGVKPDLILTSSAPRAMETSSIFAEILNIPENNITSIRTLYYSSAKTILDQIYGIPESVECILVVAHNPGISDLTRGLSSGKAFFMDNTQVSVFEYKMQHWYQIDENKPVAFQSHKVTDSL